MRKNLISLVARALSVSIGFYKSICLVCMLLISIALLAENGYIANIPITAEIGGELFYSIGIDPQSIYTCSDDGVVVIALALFSDEEIYSVNMPVVVKLDPLGNLVWKRTYGYDYDYVTGIGIDENDTVSFIAASINGQGGSSIISVDLYGNDTQIPFVISNLTYYNAMFNKALFTSTGDIVAVGYATSAELSWRNHIAFCRFNAAGELLASAYIPADTISFMDANAYDVVMEDNGNALIVGRLNHNWNEVIRLDMIGSILDRILLPGTMSLFPQIEYRVGSGQAIIVYGDIPIQDEPIVYFIRLAGSDVSSQTFPALMPMSMNVFGDSVIIAAIYLPHGYRLMRFDFSDSYNLSWAWYNQNFSFPEFTINELFNYHIISHNSAGCFYVTGSYFPYLEIAKILPSGQLPIEDDVQAPNISFITVYPNPMKQLVNINIDNTYKGMQTKLDIYNLRGQKVKTISTDDKGTVQWDGTDEAGYICPHGIYFIRDTKGLSAIKKIVKH